jgi:hypothetical protein
VPRVLALVVTVFLGFVLFAAAPATGQQQIEIKGRPPEQAPRPEILPPPGAKEITRPRESDFYPGDIRVRLDPAFIAPAVTVKQTGPNSAIQMGFAGWTAPNIPVPQGGGTYHDKVGWFALGFAIIWDLPVTPARGTVPAGPSK